jgi:hypothetical protein
VDCELYWLAALQYFQLAQKFYQAGNHTQGDYCISRGDTYMQMALLCTHTTSTSIAPLLDEEPAEHDPEADPPSRSRLEAKLVEVQRLRDPQAPPPPTVSAEAANAAHCDGYYYIAWGHALQAGHAYMGGDADLGAYHVHEAQQYLLDWDLCEFIAAHP